MPPRSEARTSRTRSSAPIKETARRAGTGTKGLGDQGTVGETRKLPSLCQPPTYLTNESIGEYVGETAVRMFEGKTSPEIVGEIGQARLAAIGEANGYLATQYRIPIDLSGHPEALAVCRAMQLDLAAYHLYAQRPPTPEDVIVRYRAAVDWFTRIAEGVAQLPTQRRTRCWPLNRKEANGAAKS